MKDNMGLMVLVILAVIILISCTKKDTSQTNDVQPPTNEKTVSTGRPTFPLTLFHDATHSLERGARWLIVNQKRTARIAIPMM